MSVRSRLVAVLSAALCALTLGGCAQHRNDVAVGIGTRYYEIEKAKPYAALYLPYARMAALAYTDEQFLTSGEGPPRRGQLCPVGEHLNNPALADARNPVEANRQLAVWLKELQRDGWECIFGRVGVRNCPSGEQCVDGLQYHIWRRKDCREAVLAFRGSDSDQIGDWITNLRWFQVRDVFDQYDQVQREVVRVVKRLRASQCRPDTIIATGHSLGGGLAQHAAYTGGINYVYAFDPSPVTGIFGVPFLTRQRSVERLGVDRIYESGEILSLPRYIVSGIYPSPQCRPRVRIVRFNVIDAPTFTERHRLTGLARGMERLAAGARPSRLPHAFKEAANCDFVQRL